MASAHVTVQPNTAAQGSRGRFVFRVPNESDTASTIKIEVQTPKEDAETFASLRVMPKQGWDIVPEKTALDTPIKGETSDITEYVSKITYTAQPGTKIGPGQFDEFDFTTGVLPKDKTQIAFKIIQTYDAELADGTTEARWVEVRQEGQEDPKRPEAIVKLTPPTTVADATATPAASGDTATESGTAPADASSTASTASTAKNIGIIALILGIIALLVAVGAIAANKPKTGAATPETPGTPETPASDA